MQTTFNVCKLYLLLCLGLSTNASPILNGLKTTSSDYQQSSLSLENEPTFPPTTNFGNVKTKSNLQTVSEVDQSLKNTPGITTTYRDQNGNLVTQVKKEIFNKDNGQSSHTFEMQESKQLPNGYSKSFKKEYSSSSVNGPQPILFVQKPLNTEKYYNSEQLSNGESSSYGSFQNYQGQSIPANIGNIGIKSNFKSTVDQSLTNVPGITSTFRDQNGNIVTQVKKEIVTNNDGQNGHVTEFEETKQLPNGYSKSFRKEYSSSSVTGPQPTIFVQKPLNTEKYYNSEQLSNGESSSYGSFQNYQGQSIPANVGNIGIKSNFKSTVDQSLTNVPGVTSTFRDQNGNIVTQIKKEIVTNNDGLNGHVTEFEETKQLPNGYSKSFRKEYSSSSVVGIPPTLIKVNTTEKNMYSPQKFTQKETEKFNGYNTFFNNQKYTSDPNSPINSQVFNNKKQSLETTGSSFGHSTTDQIDCEEGSSSTSLTNQNFKQQTINTHFLPVNQQVPVNNNPYSTLTQEKVGQQSVNLHGYSQPSQIGQQSVDITNSYVPKKPSGQKFEKIESFSTQTQEEVGQQSVDLHGYLQPSHIGQQSVDITNSYAPKKPSGQKFEKIESFSTQTQEEVGQQSVDLHGYLQPSQIGQQSVDLTSNLEGHNPTYQKQYGNVNFQSSKLLSQTGKLSTGNDEPITSKYNSVFDKLGQLEHEILGAKSTVNINNGNLQTTYSTNHNVKSMPVQTSQQESHFSKTINENTQYIEPESEIAYSKSFKKDSKLVIQQDAIENHTSNNELFSENLTTPSSVWKKIGDKFKGTIENAKNKAQQLASNINDKVGFSSVTGNPC